MSAALRHDLDDADDADDAGDAGDAGDTTASRSAALLLRVWIEPHAPDDPRARLLAVGDAGEGAEPSTWATAVGDAAIGREVLRWLGEVRAPAAEAPPRSSPLPLVAADWVEAHLDDPEVVLVEVDGDPGRYPAGHLPGALRLGWFSDLHHPTRRAFVDAGGFAALMEARGISRDAHVVLYGARGNALAASAYWCFAYYGHPRLSLLDGGRAGWLAGGRPLTTAASPRPPVAGYPPASGRRAILATRDDVLAAASGHPGLRVLDCRTAREFAGRPRYAYDVPVAGHRVTGHVPGARNLPVEEVVDHRTQLLLPEAQLRELCARRGIDPGDEIVVHCGATDRSSLVWFVLHELLRWPRVRSYYGGWAEYGSLVDVPVERGQAWGVA